MAARAWFAIAGVNRSCVSPDPQHGLPGPAARLKYGRTDAMAQRDHDRSGQPGQARSHTASPRRGASPILALQHAIGNRGTTRVLARQAGSGRGTFEHSVRIGKLGPIEITESNIAEWTGGKGGADELVVTTVKGKHSDELNRMADGKTRIDSLEVQSITGQNSWVIVTFKNAVIKGYTADSSGKTEQWKAIRFDRVDIKRTSIGAPRP
jgi:hypothetical protein